MEKQDCPKLSEPKIVDVYNKKQGYWYVYNDSAYWDPEKKQTRHTRKIVGKRLAKDGPIIYSNRYSSDVSDPQTPPWKLKGDVKNSV